MDRSFDDGATGIIIGSIEDAVRAVEKICCFDQQNIRRIFEQRFLADMMARSYLSLYRRGLAVQPTAKGLPNRTI